MSSKTEHVCVITGLVERYHIKRTFRICRLTLHTDCEISLDNNLVTLSKDQAIIFPLYHMPYNEIYVLAGRFTIEYDNSIDEEPEWKSIQKVYTPTEKKYLVVQNYRAAILPKEVLPEIYHRALRSMMIRFH